MVMKVALATAAVAKIANKTLKQLCMVIIRGTQKDYWCNRTSYPEKGSVDRFSIDDGRLVSGKVRLIANGYQRKAVRFHLASMRALMRPTLASCAAQNARLAAAVPQR